VQSTKLIAGNPPQLGIWFSGLFLKVTWQSAAELQ
jgi:hypothetical protein